MEPSEDRLELSGLRRRNGIGKERRGAVLAEIADALRAEVRIEHDERGGVERRELRLQKGRRQVLVDSHIVHGKRHIAVAVREEQVGRGRAVGNIQAVRQVDAEIGTGRLDALRAVVRAERGDEPDLRAEQGEVVGDVAAHAAEARADASGVRVSGDERGVAPPAYVDVHAADDGNVG